MKNTYPSCLVCSSPIARWATKRTAGLSYHIDRCRRCGYAFVNPRPSFEFLMDYYSSYGLGSAKGERDAPSLASVQRGEQGDPNSTVDARRLLRTIKRLSAIPRQHRFLDVGCGYGFFSKEALSHGFEVTALEVAKNDRAIAQQMTGLNPIDCCFEDFKDCPGSFSVVLMSQILEHALDVNLWINRANALLQLGGILAIALPNFGSLSRKVLQEREPYICPPAHLNFFTPFSLAELLRRHGFRVEKTQWVSRIPRSSFEKRLSGATKPLLPLVRGAAWVSLKMIDALRLGIMINVYARKTNPSPWRGAGQSEPEACREEVSASQPI